VRKDKLKRQLVRNIIRRQKQLQLTDAQLSRDAGICRQTLWRIKKRESIDVRVNTLLDLSIALQCRMSDLIPHPHGDGVAYTRPEGGDGGETEDQHG